MEFITKFDAEEIRRVHESASSRRVKRDLIEEGYTEAMSIYGVVRQEGEEEPTYCRIEILANGLYSQKAVASLYTFFKQLVPLSPYTIWIYDVSTGRVKCAGRYA